MQKSTSIVPAFNKRKYPRVAVGQGENLSLGGMFLATDRPQRVGSRILVDIGIGQPNEPPIRATSIVRWRAKRRGVGGEFVAFRKQEKDRLQAWLKGRESDPPPSPSPLLTLYKALPSVLLLVFPNDSADERIGLRNQRPQVSSDPTILGWPVPIY